MRIASPIASARATRVRAQTMDTYSHLMEGMGNDAVGGLDEAFG